MGGVLAGREAAGVRDVLRVHAVLGCGDREGVARRRRIRGCGLSAGNRQEMAERTSRERSGGIRERSPYVSSLRERSESPPFDTIPCLQPPLLLATCPAEILAVALLVARVAEE